MECNQQVGIELVNQVFFSRDWTSVSNQKMRKLVGTIKRTCINLTSVERERERTERLFNGRLLRKRPWGRPQTTRRRSLWARRCSYSAHLQFKYYYCFSFICVPSAAPPIFIPKPAVATCWLGGNLFLFLHNFHLTEKRRRNLDGGVWFNTASVRRI